MKKKKKIINIVTIIVLIIIIGFIVSILPKKTSTTSSPFKNFSEVEISWIKTLSKQDQDYFLENQDLHSLIKQKSFQASKFAKYIDFYKKNKTLDFETLIMLVNHNLQDENIEITDYLMQFFLEKDFEPNRLKRYIAYKEENPTLEIHKVVSFVNQDIDTITMKYDTIIDEFFKAKYFVQENLGRYLKYANEHNTNVNTTVSYINSNLDYDYYTNTTSADLKKDNLILVNKYYALDENYEPDNMVQIEAKYGVKQYLKEEAYEAFKKMADDAKKKGLTLYITSPYRSYQTQDRLYNNYSAKDGKELADTYSARPGYSEHQTGLAIDITNGPNKSLDSFVDTEEYRWIKSHAHLYGFILRYPKGKAKVKMTGYQYEPWHYRYLGIDTATKVYTSQLTYEEYYAYYLK